MDNYQKKEMMDDLYKKDSRIQSLERDCSELCEKVDALQKKLDTAIEGLMQIHSSRNPVIAEKCLDEIDEA